MRYNTVGVIVVLSCLFIATCSSVVLTPSHRHGHRMVKKVRTGPNDLYYRPSPQFKSNETVGYFWQLTDMHVDPWYRVGSAVNTMCHNKTTNGTTAGVWGDYHCHTNYKLLHSAFQEMLSVNADPDFILWTGDDSPMNEDFPFPDPDLWMNQERVFYVVQNLTKEIRNAYPNTRLIPCLGNHEVWPPSQLWGTDKAATRQIFSTIGDYWKDIINSTTAQETFTQGGYYTTLIQPGWRVLSLNTLWCDLTNLIAEAKLIGDVNKLMFDWMTKVLADAREANETVWIIGHIPPDPEHYFPYCINRFYTLLDQYNDMIRGQFYGHTHNDQWGVVRVPGSKDKASNMFYVAPSLTPESWHKIGRNPALRLYSYDKTTKQVLQYWQYYADLDEANKSGNIKWELEYIPTESYNMTDLSPDSWLKVSNGLTSSPSLFSKVWEHFGIMHNGYSCDAKCVKKFACKTSNVRDIEYAECLL